MRPHANAKGWLANHLAYRDIKCKASATSLILGPCSVRPTRRKGTGTEAYPRGKPRQATPPAYEATHRAGRSAPSTSLFEARSWRLPERTPRPMAARVTHCCKSRGTGLTRVAVADTDLRAPRRCTFCCAAPRGCIKNARAGGRRLIAPCAESARARGRGDCLVTQAHSSRETDTHSHNDKLIACCE